MVRDRSQTPKLRARLPPVTSTYLRGMQMSSSHPAAAVLAAVLAEHGVRHAVVSPGSRNAPLVLALHHNPDIDVRVSIDERAAAHHALGLALATWTPVPVVCTSGTAALNHGPALAEAYHARIPLLSITADRPAGVIGRGHGQTLNQAGVHAPHTIHHDVLDESIMDVDTLATKARHAVRQALHGGPGQSAGPVHLNVPFEEPLYDLAPAVAVHTAEETALDFTSNHADFRIPEALGVALDQGKVLVVAGPRPAAAHRTPHATLEVNLPCLAERGACVEGPLVVHGGERLLHDGQWPEALKPEAVITLGLPPMSKALRAALAGVPQWHVGTDLEGEGSGWDIWATFQGEVPASVLSTPAMAHAKQTWGQAKALLQDVHAAQTPEWSDLSAWKTLVDTWRSWDAETRPKALHVANSASARYAQWSDLGEVLGPDAAFHANRGVAGIDGCTSTAVGWAAATGQATWLVTGDVAFHYDSNALLTDPVPSELHIVVMNNGGGGIFRWLPGTKHPDLFERHFETPPNRTVEAQAQAMGATHFLATNDVELRQALTNVLRTPGPTVLEVRTPSPQSAAVLADCLAAFRRETKSTFG